MAATQLSSHAYKGSLTGRESCTFLLVLFIIQFDVVFRNNRPVFFIENLKRYNFSCELVSSVQTSAQNSYQEDVICQDCLELHIC